MALLLLGLLPQEFDFLETILHGKTKVITMLYSHGLRQKEKLEGSGGAVAEALVMRGHSQSRSTERKWRPKSKPSKDECAFCREKVHGKQECSKLRTRRKIEKERLLQV